MISITIENLARIEAALRDTPKKVNVVLSRVINRATTTANATMAKKVSERYAVKSGDVKKTVVITRATSSNPNAVIKSAGKRTDFVDFKITPKILFKGQHNYSVQILRAGGMKPVYGFAAASNKWGLFKRKGREREPFSRLMGPAVPQMIGQEDVISSVERETMAMIDRRIEAELNFLGIEPR